LLLGSGTYAVGTSKERCTHVLVDEGSAVPEMVIVAVASSKPVFQINWWQIEHLLNLLSLFAWWQLVQLVVQLLFSLNMEVLTTAGSGLQKFTLETEVVTELLPYSRFSKHHKTR
jgi:hypothetical protein